MNKMKKKKKEQKACSPWEELEVTWESAFSLP